MTTTSDTRFAIYHGQRIAYDVTGEGPAVVLLHWALVGNRRSWQAAGFVDALRNRFRVICIDALGYGESDKPTNSEEYQLANIAGAIASVLDAEQLATAHVVGYSLGGWHTVGMLRHRPERLRSAVVGGWDPVGGLKSQPPANRDFETVLATMRAGAPALVAWVTEEIRPAVRNSWEATSDLAGADTVLRSAPVPILLWCGRDDGPYRAVSRIAGEVPSVRLLSVEGDHGGAVFAHAEQSVDGVSQFLDRVEAQMGGGRDHDNQP